MLNATVKEKIETSPWHYILRIQPDFEIPEFLPGQYVALGLPGDHPRAVGLPPEEDSPLPGKLLKRAYSLTSDPKNKEFLEIYLIILPLGQLTSRIMALSPEDRLFISPKIVGTFTLFIAPDESDLVFLSTGTGIAPFISMLRSLKGTPRKITLAHGVRHKADLAYREEILTLKDQGMNIEYYPITSRENSVGISKGYVQNLIKESIITPNPLRDHVFLCGNPSMIEEIGNLLVSRGFVVNQKKIRGNLYFEKYW